MKSRGDRGRRGRRGDRGDFILDPLHLDHLDHLAILVYLGALVLSMVANPLPAQSPDPRPNECWGFVFGAWSPSLDWSAAGHTDTARGAPPTPEASTTDGAPRHDAASFARTGGPALILYPTWWPVGVGISLERQPVASDTVPGIAYAFVADGRVTPPESRLLAWRKPCGDPPVPSATRAAPDERRLPPAAPADARPRRTRAARPR